MFLNVILIVYPGLNTNQQPLEPWASSFFYINFQINSVSYIVEVFMFTQYLRNDAIMNRDCLLLRREKKHWTLFPYLQAHQLPVITGHRPATSNFA